jgi:hypothetical protein
MAVTQCSLQNHIIGWMIFHETQILIKQRKSLFYQLLSQLAAEHQAYHHQTKQGADHLEEILAALQN